MDWDGKINMGPVTFNILQIIVNFLNNFLLGFALAIGMLMAVKMLGEIEIILR